MFAKYLHKLLKLNVCLIYLKVWRSSRSYLHTGSGVFFWRTCSMRLQLSYRQHRSSRSCPQRGCFGTLKGWSAAAHWTQWHADLCGPGGAALPLGASCDSNQACACVVAAWPTS